MKTKKMFFLVFIISCWCVSACGTLVLKDKTNVYAHKYLADAYVVITFVGDEEHLMLYRKEHYRGSMPDISHITRIDVHEESMVLNTRMFIYDEDPSAEGVKFKIILPLIKNYERVYADTIVLSGDILHGNVIQVSFLDDVGTRYRLMKKL